MKTVGTSNNPGANFWSIGFLVNTYYDFFADKLFSPYVGVGIGFANVHMSSAKIINETKWSGDSDNVFAYQFGFGSGIKLDRYMTIDLGYRYNGTSEYNIDQVKTNFSGHNLILGLRYYIE